MNPSARPAAPPPRLPALKDLRTVTMGVLLLSFLALAAIQWFSARWLYDQTFDAAEFRDVLAQARHAQTYERAPLDYLQRTTIDNGLWDEAYDFMLGKNPLHPNNLAAMSESFRMLRMSAYAFVRLDGRVFFVRKFDDDGRSLVYADDELTAALGASGNIGRRLVARSRVITYSRVGQRIYAWCSAPIMHSDATGPQVGWWIMLSELDARFLSSASQAVGAQVSLQVRPPRPEDARPLHSPIESGELRVSMTDESTMEVRFPLGTLDEEGSLDMVLRGARDAHMASVRASKYLLWTTLLFGSLLSMLALRFVGGRLIGPVEAASRELVRIGRSGDLSVRLAPAPAEDEIGRLVDATNEMLAELERKRDVEAAMLGAIPDALLRVDLRCTVLELRLPDATPRGGWPLPGASLTQGLADPAAQALAGAVAQVLRSGASQHVEYEMAGQGGRHTYEARITRINTEEALVLLRDITQRKRVEDQVRRLAYFDLLTGLPNRGAFLDRLGREVRRAHHSGARFGLLFLDLDGFKQINDTLGHSAGDRALLETSERLREALRPRDAVSRLTGEADDADLARLGGDEFTMLITDVSSPEDVVAAADRIGSVLRRPFDIDGREFTLTSSIGIALFPEDGPDAETLLQHADTAMYHAKRQGRDNHQLYSAALTEQALHRLELESSLRGALARGEFHLVYQPVIELATGRLCAVEALIRWRHPERGTVAPAEFIPLAEENGLILSIGRWVLQTACADLARWQAGGLDCRVAVNLSPRQLLDPDLVASVMQTLAGHGLAPERLELEITEGAVMEKFSAAVASLNAFRARGVRVALDDFGTGYSSLGYLMQIPIDDLKIDRSFIGRLGSEAPSAAIVRAILALADALGIGVTAEGVETAEQARLLGAMDCRFVQGFHYSRPVPADEVPALGRRDWRRGESVIAGLPIGD
jgi:diguanylate cyclase (GGDEF)-like protein